MTEPERGIDGRTRAVTFPYSSLENYRQVTEAYLGALEGCLAAGKDISRIASVASFFVSRVDVPVDTLLQDRIKAAGTGAKSQLKDLEGKAAIANARLAYQEFKRLFGGPRFAALSPRGRVLNSPYGPAPARKIRPTAMSSTSRN